MKPVLALIRTAPVFPPGSMTAYASLVADAMNGSAHFQTQWCDFFDPNGGSSMRRHHCWRLRHARSFFEQYPADIYHLLDGSMAGFLPCKVWKKTTVTVHDLIPLLQMKGQLPGHPGLVGRLLICRALRALRHVAGIAAVSEHTAGDILAFTGRADVTTIPHPVRKLPAADETLALPYRYIFHVGNNAGYKNRAGVLDVFSRLQDVPGLYLVMAGPAPSPALRRKAQALARVEFRVNVTDAELSSLYKKACVFLFPSLYEGFGMPVLEAMAAGCPVVCSLSASLPGVVDDAALMAPADQVDALAKHCRRLLEDAELRTALIKKGSQHVLRFTMKQLSDALNIWYNQCIQGLS